MRQSLQTCVGATDRSNYEIHNCSRYHSQAAITDNALDQLCQFTDGDVFTDTDIDVLLFIVVTHEMEGGISDVIDMEKLAPWYACGM